MAKYRVQLVSFVTKLRSRSITVSADSEEEAVERAENRFRRECHNMTIYTDCGDTVNVDSIEKIED